MENSFCDERRALVDEELQRILNSEQFANAPTVSAFLEFVVRETVAGRGDRIKAYTIATEVFARSSQFDPSSDTIVRTTAGRVRKALQAYYRAFEADPRIVISLPKGGYIPSFDVRDTLPLPEPEASGWTRFIRQSFSRRALWAVACLFAAVAIGAVISFEWETKPQSLPSNVVISVLPAEYASQETQSLAREIDIRLAPALSRIRLADIVPPSASRHADRNTSPAELAKNNNFVFILKPTLTSGTSPELLWKLTDAASGRIKWTAREQLDNADTASINAVVDKIAFQVLGAGGAVSSDFEKYRGDIFSKPTCLSRAQIVEAIENDIVFPKMRDCLERIVANSPGDASAWAILSNLYTLRSFFYAAGNDGERAKLVELADRAAEKAVELAPNSYLTNVALMQLAFRQGQIAQFEALQQDIRRNYPGDIYLQIRIATRIARLGRGREALEIFDKARTDFGVNLKNWAPGIAVAHFAEGEYEQAHRQMQWATSELRFVLVLKAAILGKLGMPDAAAPIISKLVETNPDIKETYYRWLTDISWAESLVLDIADGLAKAGLFVDTTSSSQSSLISPTALENPI